MKITSLLCNLTLLLVPIAAHAADETAHHRATYNQINSSEKSFKKVTATFKDDPLVFELHGWFDGPTLRKIVASVPGEDGEGYEEFYLEDDQPLFVFRSYKTLDDTGRAGATIEDRFYFKDGSIFKWLTSNKNAGVLHSEDYVSESERLTSNCANFIVALKKKSPGKATASKVSEGTFTGIEEGDYAHWNMRSASGEELSLFILRPDASVEAVLGNAQSFIGKKCRVTWQESMEDIPEAGGKMKVKQVLSVVWLSKK